MEALKRRSCRTFKETPIEKEKLDKILEAGRNAPTAMDLQELHFHVITDKALLTDLVKKTQEFFKESAEHKNFANNPIIYNAPAVICMTCKKEYVQWALCDSGYASQNIMVQAESLGVANLPIGCHTFAANIWAEALKVPEEEVLTAVVLGYANDNFKPKEKVLRSKVTYH
ncbi:Nitroreductase family protein [Entamoeba marina]